MSKIVVSEFLTLDGVMQAPGDLEEDRSGNFEHGGWQPGYFDPAYGALILDGFAAADGFLLGRLTYENFARWWPNAPADDPVGRYMNDLPKYVVSSTLVEPLSWQNSTLLGADVPGEVANLRAKAGKDIQVIGSGQLVAALMRHGLVDEYRLMIHPLVLGDGKRLFRQGSGVTPLKLVNSTATAAGVVLATYVPDGARAA